MGTGDLMITGRLLDAASRLGEGRYSSSWRSYCFERRGGFEERKAARSSEWYSLSA